MKYIIYYNKYLNSKIIAKKIIELLNSKNWHLVTEDADLIISIGGDGTFLRTFQTYFKNNSKAVFLPINSGKIGFFSYCSEKTALEEVEKITNSNEIFFNEQILLQVKYNSFINYSLNEVRIIDNGATINGDIMINKNLLEHFRGSGLAFSTPIGSTGYSKSINGAIILNGLPVYQMVEVAPVSNNEHRTLNSPLILSDNSVTTFKPDFISNINVVVDGVLMPWELNHKFDNKGIFEIKITDKKLKIISNLNEKQNLYLKNKLILNKIKGEQND